MTGDLGTSSQEDFQTNVVIEQKDLVVMMDGKPNKKLDDEAWATLQANLPESKKWSAMTHKEVAQSITWGILKGLGLVILLYFFVCSLDLLSSSFQLLGGRATGEVFSHPLLANPIVGLMIGVLATVLVQSSSTSTSIVVSLVAAGFFPSIEMVIPIIMGANVGTSVTNTIVALTRIGDRAEFGRAFAGATVHDMFNWLTVIILLTLEVTTGYLFHLTEAIMNSFNFEHTEGAEIEIIGVITDPFTKSILIVDKEVLQGWAIDDPAYDNRTLLKIWCGDVKCKSLCSYMALSDMTTGAIMTVISLVALCTCLILIVKLLQSILQGAMANVIRKTVNADIPYVPWLTGYLAILVGAVATFLLQSSSVFTSALTPLVGMGIITVSRTYPLTLGSNIGTTTTAILAALTAPPEFLRDTLQVAFCHLFFNISGILIFYPIPFMRWPLPLARGLGRTTAKYRWFAVAYLLGSFIIIPLVILGLSLVDSHGYTLIAVLSLVGAVIIFVVLLNLLQRHIPSILPNTLKTWDWLPLPLRSLEPTDRVIQKLSSWCKCCKCCSSTDPEEGQEGLEGEDNKAFGSMTIE